MMLSTITHETWTKIIGISIILLLIVHIYFSHMHKFNRGCRFNHQRHILIRAPWVNAENYTQDPSTECTSNEMCDSLDCMSDHQCADIGVI